VNVNNCFSSTYENYRVVVNLTGATAGALNMRLRNAGADLTTSTYSRFGVDAGATAPAASNLAAQSAFLLAGSLGSNRWSGHIEFFKSQESAVKSFVATAVIESGYGVLYGGFNSTATAHDGFSIYPASGTITGLIRVYGYRN
jgi:hypothetical protein